MLCCISTHFGGGVKANRQLSPPIAPTIRRNPGSDPADIYNTSPCNSFPPGLGLFSLSRIIVSAIARLTNSLMLSPILSEWYFNSSFSSFVILILTSSNLARYRLFASLRCSSGVTKNGKRFEWYGNNGFCERSRYCGSLWIEGIGTVFTSGTIAKAVEYVINN